MAIEARQSVVGAEPQKAARIADNPADAPMRQAFSDGVVSDRELFGSAPMRQRVQRRKQAGSQQKPQKEF